MQEYVDARFRNHPSIAPVLILHVFKPQVTRVSHTNNLKCLEGRIAKLETNLKNPKKSKDGKDKDGEQD
jgi:hypothetical protein